MNGKKLQSSITVSTSSETLVTSQSPGKAKIVVSAGQFTTGGMVSKTVTKKLHWD